MDWISVNDRLPEKDQRVLVVYMLQTRPNPTPWYGICWFTKNLNKIDDYNFYGKKYKRSGFYNNDSDYGCYEVSGITHWMPLPEFPKEENN